MPQAPDDRRLLWQAEFAALDDVQLLDACKSAIRLAWRSRDSLSRDYRDTAYEQCYQRKRLDIWEAALAAVDEEIRRDRDANRRACEEIPVRKDGAR